MERHLEQLCNENPLLLTTIQNAIFSGYERSRDFVRQCGGNSISDFRVGYVRHASIEPLIFRAVEEAGLRLDIKAPTQQCPSMTMALEDYIKRFNKENKSK